MSWVPLQLLGVLRLTETRGAASRLRWIAVLAGTFGLTILAGEPRAIADAGVIVAHLRGLADRSASAAGPGPAAVSVSSCWRPGARRLPRCGAVAARPGRHRHVPARGELGGPVQLGLAPAPVAAADAGAGPAGRLRLARPARLLRELQPGRGDGLRRDPPARGGGRPARPPPAAAAAARVGSLARHGAGRGSCSRSAATPPPVPCSSTCPSSAVSGCRAATSWSRTWRSPSFSPTGPTSRSATRAAVPPGTRRPPGGPGDGPRPPAPARHDRRRRARPILGHGPPPLAAGWPGRRQRWPAASSRGWSRTR